MKNKALIGTLAVLALLVIGVLFVSQKQDSYSSEDKVVKIGILQFVTHDALDEIERGIEDGLADAGYEGSNVELTVLNAEADQSKIQTMSKKLDRKILERRYVDSYRKITWQFKIIIWFLILLTLTYFGLAVYKIIYLILQIL